MAYGAIAAAGMLLSLRTRRLPTARQAGAALGLSVLGFTGYYLLLVLAIRDAGTEVPTLIIGTIPIWVMLLGKPGHLRWGALAPGLLLTLAGLCLMMSAPRGAPGDGLPESYARGLLLAAASLLCWTAFAIGNAAWLKRHPEVNATDWANWLGVATGLGAVALWLVAGSEMKTLDVPEEWSLFAILSIASGFGSSWLATVLWNLASQRLSASLCGQLIVSETLFALLYSFSWDGRWPTWTQWLACGLFTLGILASIKAHR
jgi:drug/metabolite transporter (DMT)-like permease